VRVLAHATKGANANLKWTPDLSLELLLKRRVVASGAVGKITVGAKSEKACKRRLAELRAAFTRLPLSDHTAQEASDWALAVF